MLAANVVHLDHELVIVLDLRRPGISELLSGTIGQRNIVQQILGHRAKPAGWNLVIRERCVTVQRIGKLYTCVRKVASPLGRGGNESNGALRRLPDSRALDRKSTRLNSS